RTKTSPPRHGDTEKFNLISRRVCDRESVGEQQVPRFARNDKDWGGVGGTAGPRVARNHQMGRWQTAGSSRCSEWQRLGWCWRDSGFPRVARNQQMGAGKQQVPRFAWNDKDWVVLAGQRVLALLGISRWGGGEQQVPRCARNDKVGVLRVSESP